MGDNYRPPRGPRRGQPPPPPPPPPPRRPARQYDYDRNDHYAPRSRDYRRPSPPPPPPPLDYDGNSMRQFGDGRGQRGDFTFAPSHGAPAYPGDTYRPPPPPPDDYSARRRRDFRERGRGRRGGARDARRPGRDGNKPPGRAYQKPGASQRALLQFERGNTPPQLEGMNGGEEGASKYLDFDELSDFEDRDMEQSSDEGEGEGNDEEEEQILPARLQWANPEPYTALPPADEEVQKQKKDMVKLIRKARITAAEEEKAAKAALTAGDFIALDFGSDEDEEEELIQPAVVVPGAPTGPSADRVQTENTPGDQSRPTAVTSSAQPEGVKVGEEGGTVPPPPSRIPKRKRPEIEDEEDEDELLKEDIRRPSKSLKRPPKSSGRLLPDWHLHHVPPALRKKKALPWFSAAIKDSLPRARLHLEIVNFYRFVSPRKYEHAVRQDLLERLEAFVRKVEPDMHCKVVSFGSFAMGIYLPDADMDVTILSESYRRSGDKVLFQGSRAMWSLARRMKQERFADDYEVIAKAKVPIIKIIDRQTGLKVDISFENPSGVEAVTTFEKWKTEFPAMPIIVLVIKQFMQMRGLNDVACGGLGGFAIICMVTSLMQHLPRIKSGEVQPEHHLGEILVEFLDYYGNQFDRFKTAIRMDPPSLLPKSTILRDGSVKQAKADRLMIIDPNNQQNDISGGTSDIHMILNKFREAKHEVLDALNTCQTRNRVSLIDWMLGGNYDTFLWYRRRLKEVYTSKWGATRREGQALAA